LVAVVGRFGGGLGGRSDRRGRLGQADFVELQQDSPDMADAPKLGE